MGSRSSKIFLFLILTVAWQLASAGGVARTLLVIGDSLSAGYGIDLEDGWVSLLQNRLTEQEYGYRVVNASISGDTTTGGVTRLPRALELHQPDIVLIELGGNDGLRGTPIHVVKDNLAAMIQAAQENGAEVVLAGMQMPPNYGADYAQDFADLYKDLAAEYETALIDFFLAGVALDPNMMQADNLHPNKKGQPLLLENAWAVLVTDVLEPASTGLATDGKKY
ncbi:MAG: arylesterase [Gammaproteobacteria bacterium]|jgi:acyl-CoA thioesterase-1